MPTLPSKDSLEILEPMERPTSIITFEEGEPLRGARAISCEISINLTYGGIPFAAMTAMSSGLKPERHHEHLARGRVMSGRTGCGLCGIDDFSPLLQACAQKVSALNVPLEVIRRALTVLESEQTLNECARSNWSRRSPLRARTIIAIPAPTSLALERALRLDTRLGGIAGHYSVTVFHRLEPIHVQDVTHEY